MTAAAVQPRETKAKRKKGQPVRGSKQIRRRLPGYPRFRVASGVYTEADFTRCDDAVQAAAAAGRRDWLDAILKGQRAPVDLANALRDVKMRAAQLPEPVTMPFTEEVVLAWLARVKNRYAPETLKQMRIKLAALTGARVRIKTPKGGPQVTFGRAPNWTNHLDELPAIVRLERERHAGLESYKSFGKTKAIVMAFLKDTMGKNHHLYRDVQDIAGFTDKEISKAPLRRKLSNLTIAEALLFADRLKPEEYQPWITTLLTGANPKELWEDGMTYDLTSGGIFINGQKRKGRRRIVPRLTLTWRGKTYTPDLSQPRITYHAYQNRLRINHASFAQAYDARRSYSRFLEEAGLPHLVLKAYMGHGPASDTERYVMANGKYAQDKASLASHRETITTHLQRQLELADAAELTDKLPNMAKQAG